tara:strand:+ start:173 stop:541 length:369 start_codon:yes stop_codon:yes gene_type:complete
MLHAHEFLVKEGLDKTVWGERIIRAELLGNFTCAMNALAEKWSSCACGNLDAHIQTDGDGAPDDAALYNLGMDFHHWVDEMFDRKFMDGYVGIHNEFHGAAITLAAIEKRSIELLHLLRPAE